ncbi:hypothetical protein NIES4073_37670 [Kalymmatonema gypsitolerans NIES-4073]|jgi:hypothetical protein|nr:hypothetical protein NIES4073_34590 [Scytonema sp. NIES-4073]BAZ22879.1 hypothetical protein NIES4073_37670 [Scytonema sp. NIES-4073]
MVQTKKLEITQLFLSRFLHSRKMFKERFVISPPFLPPLILSTEYSPGLLEV